MPLESLESFEISERREIKQVCKIFAITKDPFR